METTKIDHYDDQIGLRTTTPTIERLVRDGRKQHSYSCCCALVRDGRKQHSYSCCCALVRDGRKQHSYSCCCALVRDGRRQHSYSCCCALTLLTNLVPERHLGLLTGQNNTDVIRINKSLSHSRRGGVTKPSFLQKVSPSLTRQTLENIANQLVVFIIAII